MKHPRVLSILLCLLPATLAAQTEIGGGTCSTATLSGIYAFSLTGRQIASAGNVTGVFQANGSANFDGLSKVAISLTEDTLASAAAPLAWSGTYTMQANCAGVVTITSGGTATLNLVLYDTGSDFLLTGNDATYAYAGSGNTQPANCSTSSLSGVYAINATGFGISGSAAAAAADLVGLVQFDGQGHVTGTTTLFTNGQTFPLATNTGSYTVSSNCLGSATLGNINMSLSVDSATAASTMDFFVTLANATVRLSGAGHAVYGQSTTAAAIHGVPDTRPAKVFADLVSQAADGGTK